MKRLIEFPLEDGTIILVEVDEPEGAGRSERVARGGVKSLERASQSFETALDKMKPAASAVISKLRGLTDSPDEIGVEFGLKFNAKSGVILASASVEANFKVALKWKKNQK